MTHTGTKSKYRLFCDTAPADFPLFMQHWYLDAVGTGGTWEVILVEEGGTIMGVWPYFIKKKAVWQYVAMPPMGKMMGPYLVPEARTPRAEHRVLQALVAQLPAGLAEWEQDCNYTFKNWLPLYWEGFRQTTRYFYTLNLNVPDTDLWQGISNEYRRKIKKAEQLLDIRHDLGPAQLYETGMESFRRQGIPAPFDYEYFLGVYNAVNERGAGRDFFALDRSSGEVCSAGWLIWDQHSAYALWGGDHPAHRHTGSGVWLLWERIRYSRQVLQVPVFDFVGSMIKNIEQGRRDFGAVQQPYFRIVKHWSTWFKWGRFLQQKH